MKKYITGFLDVFLGGEPGSFEKMVSSTIFKSNISKRLPKANQITPQVQSVFKKSSKVDKPQTFDDYIGQETTKDRLKKYIKVAKENKTVIPHILIHGVPGTGKTTLARIIANEMGVKYIEVNAVTFNNNFNIFNLIRTVNGGILFIDEIHSLKPTIIETLYTLMEDFSINGFKVKPFTLIGATTKYGDLVQKFKPLCDRFIPLELTQYTKKDLFNILKRYSENVLKTSIDDNVLKVLSKNCRYTPRVGIQLLKDTYNLKGDYKTALNNYGIVKEGYTTKDIKLLKYLNENGEAGINSICSYLPTHDSYFTSVIEPYLITTGVIIRTKKGRKITKKGIEFLNNLEYTN